jgi:hypothetical protein
LHVVGGYSQTDTTYRDFQWLTTNDATNPFGAYLGVVGNATPANRAIVIGTGQLGSTNAGNLALQAYGGNVGIGTASPSQKLQVAGSAVIDSALTVGTSLTLGSGDLIYTNSQTIRANTSDGSDNLRVFLAGGGAVSSSQGGYVFASGNESATPGVVGLVAGDGGSIQLTNGNVGIGTTSPAAKLYVYGATGAPTTFADYNLGQAHLNGTSGSANEVVKLTFSNPYSQTTTGANAAIGAQFKSDGSYLYLGTSNSYPGITNTALTINPSGNVGIGTTTPGYQLTTTNGFALNQTTPATNYVGGNLMLNRADSASEFGTSNNYDLHFRTNDTRRMTITSGGNVGIGNSAPTAPLAIGTAGSNTLPTNTKIWVSGAGSGASTAIQNRISLGVDNNQDYGAYFGVINLDGSFNQIAQFGTRVNGTDYATLNLNQGNVGIGTTTPNRQLTISNSSQTYMNLVNTATGGRDFVIGSEVLSGAGRFVIYDSSSGGGYRMTIDAGGNVGIGTTSPTSALQVNGSAGGAEILLGSGSTGAGNNTYLQISRSASTGGYINVDAFKSGVGGTALALNAINGGNVGIGTNSPTYKLDITDTIGSAGANITGNGVNSYLRFSAYNNTNVSRIGTESARDFVVYNDTNNAYRLVINTAAKIYSMRRCSD